MKEERNNNGRGIFYGVIGVATLIVAIIGATFAYFTATQSNNNTITGNAAAITFSLAVNKVTTVDNEKGMIPMTDAMVEAAVTASTPCQDDNGNAVCQIYKITVTNGGTASMFLDGYVNLTGGLAASESTTTTTMRWAQVINTGTTEAPVYAMSGNHVIASNGTASTNSSITWTAATANTSNVKTSLPAADLAQTTGTYTFLDNTYDRISNNYVRTSTLGNDVTQYTRDDTMDALVYNQYLNPMNTNGASSDLYIVVWLHETETNQNPTADTTEGTNFFSGTVLFNSGGGGEVSATFSGYARTTTPTP